MTAGNARMRRRAGRNYATGSSSQRPFWRNPAHARESERRADTEESDITMANRPDNRKTLARRHAVAALASASLGGPLGAARGRAAASGSFAPPPRQTLGPFYPRSAAERPAATDPDLIVVEGARVVTQGVPLYLTGHVLARDGKPVAQALV